MESSKERQDKSLKSNKKFPRMLNDSANSIAVYTIFCILRGMRSQLCLEAMLEYMEQYLATVERHNPVLKNAVAKALSMISISQMYKDAMR